MCGLCGFVGGHEARGVVACHRVGLDLTRVGSRRYRTLSLALVRGCLFMAGWLAIMVPAWSQTGTPLPFRIDSASTKPNYPLTQDEKDLEQLTDQVIEPFPAWTRRGSVGWSQRTPVTLIGQILDGAARQVIITTARSSSAGVMPPARIDAYCRTPTSRWHHVGQAVPAMDAAQERTAVNISMSLDQPCTGELALVFNAYGSFLMIDEIAVVGRFGSAEKAQAATDLTPSVDDTRADSIQRLRQQYMSAYRAEVRATLARRGPDWRKAWMADPWQPLALTDAGTGDRRAEMSIAAPDEWPVSFVLGLANGSAETVDYRVDLGDVSGDQAQLFELLPVLAANGKVIPDALRPMHGRQLAVEPRSVAWIHVTLAASVGTGSRPVRVLSGDQIVGDMRLLLSRTGHLPVHAGTSPNVGVWSYLSDSPIWSPANAQSIIRGLTEAGVNVFVVHPDSIPVPGVESQWMSRAARLRAELAAYRGAGTVLLYLAWERTAIGQGDAHPGETEVTRWLRYLISLMEESGYRPGDWALYPVDEPGPANLTWLLRVARWIKAQDRSVRIYANPGRINWSDVVPGSAVGELMEVVDIWQPLRGDAADRLAPALRKARPGRWWIYQVGAAPAKSIPPWCYRQLGSEAAGMGASGFGFWSFSDTGGSSAWDDLDGTRPDWAVVYEDGKGGIVSSRRWEAFQQGIREFRALSACKAVPDAAPCKAGFSLLPQAADPSLCR